MAGRHQSKRPTRDPIKTSSCQLSSYQHHHPPPAGQMALLCGFEAKVIYYVAVVGRDLNFNHELLLLPLLLPLGLRLEIAIMSDGDKVSEAPRKNGQLENRLSPPHPTFYTPNPRSPFPYPTSSPIGACLQFVNATAARGLICTWLPLNYVLSASVGHRVTPMHREYI
uniref:HDC02532 n=1 Tax=Drosophila melanogaster TaxID=7227 RepID=Q6IHI4_DROME|nr:TPA_inf: HDC02532 [Drosophila melanogaster]